MADQRLRPGRAVVVQPEHDAGLQRAWPPPGQDQLARDLGSDPSSRGLSPGEATDDRAPGVDAVLPASVGEHGLGKGVLVASVDLDEQRGVVGQPPCQVDPRDRSARAERDR